MLILNISPTCIPSLPIYTQMRGIYFWFNTLLKKVRECGFWVGQPGSLITESFPVCLLGRIIAKGKKIPKIVAVVGYKRDDICAAGGRRVSTRREIGPAVWRGPEHSTSTTPQSQDTRAVCRWGKWERELVGGRNLLPRRWQIPLTRFSFPRRPSSV